MTQTLTATPAADGFWMPAEFEPHAGCWMLWPERPDNWREAARPAQHAFAAVAAAIAEFEPVTVGVSSSEFQVARALLDPRVRVLEISHDDCWMRDVGPTFVVDRRGAVRGVDWHFNAWGGLQGGLYFPWDQDDLVARKVLEIEGRDRYRAPVVNEGGAIHVDGEGTALVTEECLLNINRNPLLSRERVEDYLRDYLNVTRIIWLGKGVFNDETDGHIDNLACFVRPGEVCLTWTDNKRDPQYAISLDAWERLQDERDAQGRRLKVTKLPDAGSADAECEGGERHHPARGHEAARGRRASCRELRELLYRQRRHCHAAARLPHGPCGRAACEAAYFPTGACWECRRGKFCWAAAIFTASPSRFPRPGSSGAAAA